MAHDWPTLQTLYQEAVTKLGDATYIRALVTKAGTTLTPQEGEPITLVDFYCQSGEAMTAHFTASILAHVGLGEFRSLRALLGSCDQLIAFRIGSEVVVGTQLRCK